jgi:hypothetical protein
MDGRDLHAASSAPGGFYPRPRAGHEIEPQPGSCYSVKGCNARRPANLKNGAHYPVEALCGGLAGSCGEIIRIDDMWTGEWYHTGRMPGDSR